MSYFRCMEIVIKSSIASLSFSRKLRFCPRPRGQREVKLKIVCLGGMMHVLRPASHQGRGNDFWTVQLGHNLKIGEKTGIPGDGIKVTIFDLQNGEIRPFFKISTRNFVNGCARHGSFDICKFYLKN